jgi:hypothetical protein
MEGESKNNHRFEQRRDARSRRKTTCLICCMASVRLQGGKFRLTLPFQHLTTRYNRGVPVLLPLTINPCLDLFSGQLALGLKRLLRGQNRCGLRFCLRIGLVEIRSDCLVECL